MTPQGVYKIYMDLYTVTTRTVLRIGTNRSVQTVQILLRLLFKKPADQGLHCLQFHLHLLDILLHCYLAQCYF